MKHKTVVFIFCILLTSIPLHATKLEALAMTQADNKTSLGKVLVGQKSGIKQVNKPLMICKRFPIYQEKTDLR